MRGQCDDTLKIEKNFLLDFDELYFCSRKLNLIDKKKNKRKLKRNQKNQKTTSQMRPTILKILRILKQKKRRDSTDQHTEK